MRDDDEPAQPEKVRTPVGLRVEPLPQSPRRRPDEQSAELPPQRGGHLCPERIERRLDRPLEELERDVSREAVADDHVSGAREQVSPLRVADEAEATRLQLRVGLPDEAVPLLRLLADREEGDLGLLDSQDLLGEQRAHLCELNEVLRLRIGVRAGVE